MMMGDGLQFAVMNISPPDGGGGGVLAAGGRLSPVSEDTIDPSSLINHHLTAAQLQNDNSNEMASTSAMDNEDSLVMGGQDMQVDDVTGQYAVTDGNDEQDGQAGLMVQGVPEFHQLVTLDGKQLFLLSHDGNLTAVTSEVLHNTLNTAITVVNDEEGEESSEASEPAAKKVKQEEDSSDDPRIVYFSPDDVDVEDDKAHTAVSPKVVTTPRAMPQSAASSQRREPKEKSDVTQAWFTTKDDKQSLQGKGHSWKQGQWSKDEAEILQNNIAQYCMENNIQDPTEIIFEMSKDERKDFYRTVAKGLNRPLFSVYRRVVRMYDQKNHIGKYTPEEINHLRELRARHGNDWAKIGSALGRSASSVKDKCRLMRDTCNTGKWLPEEEQRLADAVYSLSGTQKGENVTSGLSWAAVAERVISRSEKQCRTKWLNYLNWKQQGGTEWSRIDDLLLIDRIEMTGVSDETQIDWNDIADNWSSVRSPQWLRGKWWTMKRHIAEYNLLNFRDLVANVRNMHTQNLRATEPLPTDRHKGLRNKQGVLVDDDDSDSTTLVSYEVLQNLNHLQGVGAHQQGTFLITQPHNNPAISIADGGGAFTSDHIIVHTVPVAQIAGGSNMMQLTTTSQPHLVINSPLAGGGGGSTPPDLAGIQLSQPITIEGTVDDIDLQQQLSQHSADGVICSEEVINLHSDHFHIPNTHTEVTDDVSQSSSSVTSDIVLATSSSPPPPSQTFVHRSSSHDAELIHLSSLSDPMLPSDAGSADLICCGEEIDDDDKHSAGDDPS